MAGLGAALESAELRPALLTAYSGETLRVYKGRWAHFQAWSAAQRYQVDVTAVASERLVEYVTAYAAEGKLSPNTLKQACNAVVFYAERAGVEIDSRQAKEVVRRYREARAADGVAPAWRVAGRRSPRRGRRRSTG